MKEEKYIEDMVGKRNAFRVPDGYFDNFTAQMMQQLPEKPVAAMKELKPRAKSIWLRPIFYAAASVCAIVISATIWFAMPSEQSATTQVQAQKVLQQDDVRLAVGVLHVVDGKLTEVADDNPAWTLGIGQVGRIVLCLLERGKECSV